MIRPPLWSLVLVALSCPALPTALAGSVRLDGIADGTTVYLEQQSDAFFRMDLYDPPPRETQQRFHAISDPSVTFGNPAFDGFPNDEDFRLGSVTFDDSGLIGGTGLAPVTALVLGVGTDPSDSSHVNYGRWTNIMTLVDTVNGTVSLVNGAVTSIDLTATAHLDVPTFGSIVLNAPGTFSVTGNRFAGHLQGSATGALNTLLIWDFSGTLTTVAVPEPASLVPALLALGALLAVGRRR